MKRWPIVLLILASAGTAVWAETINEADYPEQYEVMNGNTIKSLMIGNFCTMALRSPANTNLIFIVQKRGHGGCHVPDAGTTLHGRRDKNEIQVLTRDEKGKLKVEKWPIVSTSEASTHR
jgi:hypothetical protein